MRKSMCNPVEQDPVTRAAAAVSDFVVIFCLGALLGLFACGATGNVRKSSPFEVARLTTVQVDAERVEA